MFGAAKPPPQQKVYKAWHPSMAKASSTTSQTSTPQPSPLSTPASLSQTATPVPNTPSPQQQSVLPYQSPPSFAIPRKPHASIDFTNIKPLSTIPQDLIHRYDLHDPLRIAPSLPAAPAPVPPAPAPTRPTSFAASGPGYTSTNIAGLVAAPSAPSERPAPRPFSFRGNMNKLKKRSASKDMTAVPDSLVVLPVCVETRGNAEVFGKEHGRSGSWYSLRKLSSGGSDGMGRGNKYGSGKKAVEEGGTYELDAVVLEEGRVELPG